MDWMATNCLLRQTYFQRLDYVTHRINTFYSQHKYLGLKDLNQLLKFFLSLFQPCGLC